MTVYPQPCPGLVEAIEAGDFARAGEVARGHVAALLARLPRPQSAVLGCTHYPLVEAAFRAALPPETALVAQPALVADSLADYLARHPRFRRRDRRGRAISPPAIPPPSAAAPPSSSARPSPSPPPERRRSGCAQQRCATCAAAHYVFDM